MKINYQIMLNNIINKNKKSNLLLHSCCAPCSTYTILYLKDYFNITILYYNPNIEPKDEYLKRKEEQIKFITNMHKEVSFIDVDYDNMIFRHQIKGLEKEKEGGLRCEACFRLRLEKVAQISKEKGFDYFGTTLTISPHKNCTLINEIGKKLEEKYNVNFLYADFKKNDGYKKSIELSKKYGIYRQEYCGCIFSKLEKESKS